MSQNGQNSQVGVEQFAPKHNSTLESVNQEQQSSKGRDGLNQEKDLQEKLAFVSSGSFAENWQALQEQDCPKGVL